MDAASSYGLLYIGVALACILYGITVLQTYEYYDGGSRKDGLVLKSIVAALWVLDTLHVALIIHTVWFYLVQNFDNPEAELIIPWSYGVQIIILSLIATTVEICYATRLQRITGRTLLTVATISFGVLHFAFDFFFTVKLLQSGTVFGIPPVTWATTVSLALSVASDVLISLNTCHYLWQSRTGFSRTNTILNRLMLYAVNTGLLTTIFSLLTCILFARGFTYLASLFYFSLSKFYANSLLATFNARQRLSRSTKNGDMQSFHMSKVKRSALSGFRRTAKGTGNITIDITRETVNDQEASDQSKTTGGESMFVTESFDELETKKAMIAP